MQCLENLTPSQISDVRAEHGRVIGGDGAYWDSVRSAHCVTIAHLGRCEAVEHGPTLDRQRGDRRAWFVLG